MAGDLLDRLDVGTPSVLDPAGVRALAKLGAERYFAVSIAPRSSACGRRAVPPKPPGGTLTAQPIFQRRGCPYRVRAAVSGRFYPYNLCEPDSDRNTRGGCYYRHSDSH
jgi:hypothetical protein